MEQFIATAGREMAIITHRAHDGAWRIHEYSPSAKVFHVFKILTSHAREGIRAEHFSEHTCSAPVPTEQMFGSPWGTWNTWNRDSTDVF
jgi:hypothetical protein